MSETKDKKAKKEWYQRWKKRTPRLVRRAFEIYSNQKHRAGVDYTREDFTKWYLQQMTKRTWRRPHIARFDHSKPYSFDNMEMQEGVINNRERIIRCGNPCNNHKSVKAVNKEGKEVIRFISQKGAGDFFSVSSTTVRNHCTGKSKPNKYGPHYKGAPITFRYLK